MVLKVCFVGGLDLELLKNGSAETEVGMLGVRRKRRRSSCELRVNIW
jgi:hypothetical protein